ncbi:MAG: peroxiredoxin family protein [Fimbriimonadaceae bacterium]
MKQIPFVWLGLLVLVGFTGCAEPVKEESETESPVMGGTKQVGETVEGEKRDYEPVVESGFASLSKTVVVGKQAPDFTIKDEVGKSWKLSDYKGKVVLLDFWALW